MKITYDYRNPYEIISISTRLNGFPILKNLIISYDRTNKILYLTSEITKIINLTSGII